MQQLLIKDAFRVLSESYVRIGEIGIDVVNQQNSPKQRATINKLIECTTLYTVVSRHIILNSEGTEIIGTKNQTVTIINDLLLQLKKSCDLYRLPAFPTPLTTYQFNFGSSGASFNVFPGSLGDLIVYNGTSFTNFPMGPPGTVFVSTPTGPQWQSVVGNGIPSGGSNGQYLRKNSNSSYDVVWDTLTLSKITDVTASAAEVNILDGVTATTAEINRLSGVTSPIQTQLNSKLGTALTTGQFYVGVSNVATAVAPSGDVTFNTAGVFSIGSGVIVDADINASAAITRTKIASGNPYRVVVNNASGVMVDATAITPSRVIVSDINGIPTASGVSTTTIGFMDATSSIQTQLDSKLTVSLTSVAQGDTLQNNGTNWVNTPIGTAGQVWTSNGTSASWGNAAANGLPSGGTTHQYLRKINGTNYNTEWATLVLADVTDVVTTSTEINQLSGLLTDAAHINFLSTATSDIQTQLNLKLNTSLAYNSLFVGNVSNTAGVLAPGLENQVLMITAGSPTWQTFTPGTGSVTSVDVSGGTTGLIATGGPVTTSGTITLSGTLIVSNGGTGRTTNAAYAIMAGGTTSTGALQQVSGLGTSGQVLTSNGAGTLPTWQNSAGGGGTWGSITGTLSAQTDLQSALDAKSNEVLTHNTQTGSYTLVLTDKDSVLVEMNSASPNNLTVPLNATVAFPIGTQIPVVQYGSGLTTVVATGGVTINASSGSLVSAGQYAPMFLEKRATDEWYLWNGTAGGGSGVTSVSGTSNRITSTGGTTPVIDISASYVGQSSITTLGTVTTGTWQGTSIATTYTDAKIKTVTGTTDRITIGGTSTDPTFDISGTYIGQSSITTTGTLTSGATGSGFTLALGTSTLTGDLPFANLTQISGLSVLGVTGSSTADVAGITGTSNQILRVNGAGTSLAFGSIDLSQSDTVGSSILPIANGGSGSSSAVWWSLSGGGTLTGDNTLVATGRVLKHQWGSLGTSQTDGYGIYLQNPTAATSGNQQITPSIVLEGQGYATSPAGSQPVSFMMNALPTQGVASPGGVFTLSSKVNGVTANSYIKYYTSGSIVDFTANGLQLRTNAGGVGGISLNGSSPVSNQLIMTPGFTITTASSWTSGGSGISLSSGSAISATSGNQTNVNILGTFNPASGTANFNGLGVNPIINQTGGSSGQVTMINMSPTYTSAPNVVAIDYAPSGTAPTSHIFMRNSSGSILIGATSITASTRVDQRGLGTTSSTINHRWANSSNDVLASITDDGTASLTHLTGVGSAPSISAGTGAGTGPTVSVAGTDLGGYITITTGTLPTATATVATITFSKAYGSAPKCIILTPAEVNAAGLSGLSMVYVNQSAITTTTFTITSGTSLAASTTYKWYYYIIQ